MTDTSTQKDQNQPKRDRSSNFTNNERTLLLRLANLKKNVIENHRTDGQSNTAKEQEWKNIERSFNAENLGTFRNAKSLQQKYKLIKKEIRQRKAAEKNYVSGTGGGKYKVPVPLCEEETVLAETIALTIDGLPNWYGSDSGAAADTANNDDIHDPVRDDEVQEILINTNEKFHARMYQTPKHPALKISGKKHPLGTNSNNNNSRSVNIVNTNKENTSSLAETEVEPVNDDQFDAYLNNDENVIEHALGKENEYVQDEPTEPDISEKPTDVRPFIRKRTATNNNNKKQQPFVQLALMKQEWVQAELSTTTLQKQYLTEEHEWKKRKYELEIQQMEEKHRLELQILQQKCFEFIPVEIQE